MRCSPRLSTLMLAVVLLVLPACAGSGVNYVDTMPLRELLPGGVDVQVQVLANSIDWRATGIVVRAGERYRIRAEGRWRAHPFCKFTGAGGEGMYAGICIPWNVGKIMTAHPHQMLIAKIGEDGSPFAVGSFLEFQAPRDGMLFLRMNEAATRVGDNEGAVTASLARVETRQVGATALAPVQALAPAQATPLPALSTTDTVHEKTSERRVALIIGNGAYHNAAPLGNPPNDARLMAETLRGANFELIGGQPLINADRPAMERAIREFGQALRGGAVGLFYYSGHGIQVKGSNYLIPVTADVVQESDVKYELLDAGFVLDEMANARNRLNIVILDACRNNPFGDRGLRTVSSGLAQVTAPAGTAIAYATQPGAVASDGPGRHSPYTAALAQAIRQPGLDLFATFNTVGLQVKRTTGGQQQPWLATSPIEGQFYFTGRPPVGQ